MSETFTPDTAILEAVESGHLDHALELADSLRPIDMAETIQQIAPQTSQTFFKALPNAANVFASMGADYQLALARTLSTPELVAIMRDMPSDMRVDFFKHLDAHERSRLLPDLAHTEREYLRQMATYAEGTAGAIMTSQYATLEPYINAHEALAKLRKEAPDAETIYYIFVIDQQRHILGVLSLRQLILADPESKIHALMQHHVITAELADSQEDVAQLIERYDLLTLPIVDDKNCLVGIVTYDDVMDAAREEATIDFHKSGGVTTAIENIKDSSLGLLYKKRVFWLVLLVFGNVLSGSGIAHFEHILESNIVLVFFLPLLIDSGGNAGSQSSTLMVRALATGEILIKDWFKLVNRETVVALALGLTMAAAVSTIGWYRGGAQIALVVSLSMIVIVLIGSVLGMSLPFLLSRMNLDPASSSAPLITSICDISGVVIYLFIASQFIHLPV